jgi:large-conductance mechanosensitive channel
MSFNTTTHEILVEAIINFVNSAFIIFVVLRAAEKDKKKGESYAAAPAGQSQEELLIHSRDVFKKQARNFNITQNQPRFVGVFF